MEKKTKTMTKVKAIAEIGALAAMSLINGYGTGSLMNRVAAKSGKVVAGTLAAGWMFLYHAVLIDPIIEKATDDMMEGFMKD